jgi:glycosyltransferase involved in cell wall biosynthesis
LRRILYVIDLGPQAKFGSLEEVIFILARAVREHGGFFLPVFRCPPTAEVAAMYDAAGLPFEVLDLSRWTPHTLWRLAWLVRRHRIELVHWNLYHPLNLYLWGLTLLVPSARHWMTDHISRPLGLDEAAARAQTSGPLKRLIKQLLLRRYSRVLCVSRFVFASLEAQGIWRGLSCCLHVINTDRFSPHAGERSRLRNATGTEKQFVLLAVAHLIREKGIDVAIRALKELPEQVVLWIVGDGDDAAQLKQLTVNLSLDHRVHFWGQQLNVEPYMRAADCFVCPSLWQEAAGLVVLEALACGLPVIASAVGGIPEYVEDGRNGFLCRPGAPGELADRVRRLLDDRETLSAMSRMARSVAVERCAVSTRLDEYLELYRS